MKFGLILANFGPWSDPASLADLAHLAESAGWSGIFLPDTIQMVGAEALDTSDPWIDLAVIAVRTERIRIGLIVTTPARYRPWQLARQATTIDHLSGGRLILGIGLGDQYDRAFAAFGEEPDLRRRAAMLDEGLAVIDGLWRGEPFRYHGEHYQVQEIALLPRPVQRPRIPLWVGWKWPNQRPVRRAARWDGIVPFAMDGDAYRDLTPAELAEAVAAVDEHRTPSGLFDIVGYGRLFDAHHDDAAKADLDQLSAVGATWINEFVGPEHDLGSLRTAIAKGPPSLP